MQRQQLEYGEGGMKYVHTRFLFATSNLRERLFSLGAYAFTDKPKSIYPSNLESQIFLKADRDLWGERDFI